MIPKSKYNSYVQIAAMHSRYPQFRVKKRTHLDIEFVGDLKVKPEFPVYTVSIRYKGDLNPEVRILKPELVEEPPHFYKSENKLCLYRSDNYKWNKHRLIATDIVPWVAGWIYFYEVWLSKKIWYGPEAGHSLENID